MSEPSSLVRSESPEERELNRKKTELAALEGVLAEEELVLATGRAEVFLFERRHMREVGSKYAELDDLEAKLAEALARSNPADDMDRYRAEAARKQADETAHARPDAEEAHDANELAHFAPSEDLKQLHRTGAKRIHPDLAPQGASDEEKQQRTAAMAAFNTAFANGDMQAMQAILANWEERPDAVGGEDIAAQLVRVIRQIAQVEGRLELVRRELAELHLTAMFKLWEKAQEAEEAGRDLLRELGAELTSKIAELRGSLATLEVSEESPSDLRSRLMRYFRRSS